MKKAINLVFDEIQGNPPIFKCNLCGHPIIKGGLSSSISISDDEDLLIVVCDSKCAEAFKSHPFSDQYIQDLYAKSVKVFQSL